MQDYQYDLSHPLPVCNLLVQGPKINLQLLFVKTVLNFTVVFYAEFHSFLNSLIRCNSKRDHFSLSTSTFVT